MKINVETLVYFQAKWSLSGGWFKMLIFFNKKGPKVAPVHHKFSSFITRMEDRIKEKQANTLRPNHVSRILASDNCFIFEVACFSITQHPTLCCGFLIITLYMFTMINEHLTEITNKHSYNYILPSVTDYYVKNIKRHDCGSLSPRHGASSNCGWRNGLRYGG
jgi:hypothetical protein